MRRTEQKVAETLGRLLCDQGGEGFVIDLQHFANLGAIALHLFEDVGFGAGQIGALLQGDRAMGLDRLDLAQRSITSGQKFSIDHL